jgi:hypothetical protein
MVTYQKGTYWVEVIHQFFETASTGRPMFTLQIIVLGLKDDNGNLQACPKETRTYRQTLANDAGISILKGELAVIGVQLTDLTKLHPGAPGHVSLVGMKMDMDCVLEEFNGNTVERWSIARRKLALAEVEGLQKQFGHLLQPATAP